MFSTARSLTFSVLLVLASFPAATQADTSVQGKISPVQASPSQIAPEAKSLLMQMQDAFTGIARTSEPWVVNVKAIKLSAPATSGAPDAAPRAGEATGSGLIVRADGYVLTNDHVIDGADEVTVTLSDGREFRGKVSADFRSDLAVIKFDPGSTPLPVAPFGDSGAVLPGQWAVAIGSPFDLQNTMTVGIISAVNRHQEIGGESSGERYYPDLIQTDAAINPGNSGGPLLNIDGQVIGINVAIESPVEGSSGVGFAIPSRIAVQTMNQLIDKGKVVRGYLGLAPTDLTPALQTEFGVEKGAWVAQVDADSPAGKAGIHAADIVTEFDGQPIDGELALRAVIAGTPPGKAVPVVLTRDQKEVDVTVTIAPPPATANDTAPPAAAPPTRKIGLSVRTLTAADRQSGSLGTTLTGAYVTAVTSNSPADLAGIQEGDVITRIGRHLITSADDSTKALAAVSPDSATTVVVVRSVQGKMEEVAATLNP